MPMIKPCTICELLSEVSRVCMFETLVPYTISGKYLYENLPIEPQKCHNFTNNILAQIRVR